MAELKLPRLLAAAKEFNVGQDTIIDFLIGKGFPKDDLKPTSKLSEDMYRALQQEFQGDKAAKMKSDQLELPKGSQPDAKKKKEEEEISFRKEEKAPAKAAKKEEEVKPAVVAVAEEKPVKEEVKETAPEPAPEVEKAAEEVAKPETPGIEGPKVLKKIDLSAIDSSTRPKKLVKAKKEEAAPAAEEAKPVAKPKLKKKEEEVVAEVPVVERTAVEEATVAEERQRAAWERVVGRIW